MIMLICFLFIWDVVWFFIKACFIVLWNLTIWPFRLMWHLIRGV